MRDTDGELADLKKEIAESRGLTIKTNNLVTALGADIKAISKRQEHYERRFTWNGAVVYMIIALLCFAGFKLALNARVSSLRVEQQRLQEKVDQLQSDLEEEALRDSERTQAAANGERLYKLLEARKRTEAIREYELLPKDSLSFVEATYFANMDRRFRTELSENSYQSGLQKERKGLYQQAVADFRKALELGGSESHIPVTEFHLAKSLRQLGRTAEALDVAKQVATQTIDPVWQSTGWWLVGQCARELRDFDAAKDAMQTLIQKYPNSTLVPRARAVLRALVRQTNRMKRQGNSPALRGGDEPNSQPAAAAPNG